MTRALDDLVALLDLERIEEDIFRGRSPDEDRQRVFGGQVAGQALVAAGRTVEAGAVHSLHAYFLRPGDPAVPILYEVDRIRDGRSFTTRRVVAIQHGRAIFNMSASFHLTEPGIEHQSPMPDGVGRPEDLPPVEALLAAAAGRRAAATAWAERPRPIDVRHVDVPPWFLRTGEHPPRQRLWIRADGQLPDDPLLHACVVAYASDMSLLDTALLPHGLTWDDPRLRGASLDHAMWFHRPFAADSWLLYEQDSPTAAAGRGFARGTIHTADGRLVASVAQEGLLRVRPAPGP